MPNGVSPVIIPGLSLQNREFVFLFRSALYYHYMLNTNNVELGDL